VVAILGGDHAAPRIATPARRPGRGRLYWRLRVEYRFSDKVEI
jgi:hypothetical protein